MNWRKKRPPLCNDGQLNGMERNHGTQEVDVTHEVDVTKIGSEIHKKKKVDCNNVKISRKKREEIFV